MVKFNRRDKALKDFDILLAEIRECQNEISEDEFTEENFEIEVYSESCSSMEEESKEETTSSANEIEELLGKSIDELLVSGKSINIRKGKIYDFKETSEDFPLENVDSEIYHTQTQIERLNVKERKEYKDNKHILNPKQKKSTSQKRCKNFDD